MSTTGIAISNISKIYPFEVAVNSYSPIPWDIIINNYKCLENKKK